MRQVRLLYLVPKSWFVESLSLSRERIFPNPGNCESDVTPTGESSFVHGFEKWDLEIRLGAK